MSQTDAEAVFLRSAEIAGLAEPGDFVEAVREGYRQRGEGAPTEPRTTLPNEDPEGVFTAYLAILPDTGVMGTYTYGLGFANEDAHFILSLFDAESGEPLAVMDDVRTNPLKTGATGAIGVDELAREDASTLGIIGSGAQAAGQLRAVSTVRDLSRIDVYSPTRENREAFASDMDERLDATVRAVESSSAAVEGADVVVTATTANEPVFDGDLLEPGTHVTAMGRYDPDAREVDARTVQRAKYVPDLRARTETDAGAFIQALAEGAIDADHVHAELGEVVAGVEPGRESPEEITLFDSGGTAVETVASAHMLYQRAVERDRGQPLAFTPASEGLTGR